MGLDCIWYQEDKTKIAKVDAELNLVGGMFSGEGQDSFRGKVYDEIVRFASDITLYQEWIDNDTVNQIADALDNYDYTSYDGVYKISEDEFEDLKKMFRLHAEKGHILHGWW